jgi:hypothetical protein
MPRELPGFSLEVEDGENGPLVVDKAGSHEMIALLNAAALADIDVLGRIRARETFELGGIAVAPKAPTPDDEQEARSFCEHVGIEREDFDEAGGWVKLGVDTWAVYALADVFRALSSERGKWKQQNAREAHAKAAWDRYRSWARDRTGLFRDGATADDVPDEHMEQFLRELEAKARLVDDLDGQLAEQTEATPEVIELAGKVSAKRRFLLGELAMNGLLDTSQYERKLELLERWKLPMLADYLRAAHAWSQYMRCPERAKFAPNVPAYPPTGGAALSIDWFRKPAKLPDKVKHTPLEWAAYCENEAVRFFESQEGPGSGWWISKSWSGVVSQFEYRHDDGMSPCLYRVT